MGHGIVRSKQKDAFGGGSIGGGEVMDHTTQDHCSYSRSAGGSAIASRQPMQSAPLMKLTWDLQ
jgi:hypothetical protein